MPMKKDDHKIYKRFVWLGGLTCVGAGLIALFAGIQSFPISIMVILGLIAIYSLERRFMGIVGHLGFFLALTGSLFAFNIAVGLSGITTYHQLGELQKAQLFPSIFFFWFLIAAFIIGFVIFGIATIRTDFLPSEIGYLLLAVPVGVLLPFEIKGVLLAVIIGGIGYILMRFVSPKFGEYDEKLVAKQNMQQTQGNPPVVKPPLLVSVLCVISLALFSIQYITSFIPAVLSDLIKQYPLWYLFFLFIFFYPAAIVSSIGVWTMRRLGIYLYVTTTLIAWLLLFFFLGYSPTLGGFLFSFVFLGVSLAYWKKMR